MPGNCPRGAMPASSPAGGSGVVRAIPYSSVQSGRQSPPPAMAARRAAPACPARARSGRLAAFAGYRASHRSLAFLAWRLAADRAGVTGGKGAAGTGPPGHRIGQKAGQLAVGEVGGDARGVDVGLLAVAVDG